MRVNSNWLIFAQIKTDSSSQNTSFESRRFIQNDPIKAVSAIAIFFSPRHLRLKNEIEMLSSHFWYSHILEHFIFVSFRLSSYFAIMPCRWLDVRDCFYYTFHTENDGILKANTNSSKSQTNRKTCMSAFCYDNFNLSNACGCVYDYEFPFFRVMFVPHYLAALLE